MLKILSWALLFLSLLFFLKPQPAFAVSDPSFPACPTPGGAVIASYPDGVHGIPGDLGTHTGSDVVYSLDDKVVQCFCADSGTAGIQTNWWKVGSLTQAQINDLISQGWIYIPDGSAWGLDPVAYFAMNIPDSCGGTTTGGGGGGGTNTIGTPSCNDTKPPTPILLSVSRNGSQATLTWTAVNPVSHYTIAYGLSAGNYTFGVPDTGNVTTYTINSLDPNALYFFAVRAVNGCMPGDLASISIGGGEVLGLASTGDAPFMTVLLLSGVGLLAIGIVLKRKYS